MPLNETPQGRDTGVSLSTREDSQGSLPRVLRNHRERGLEQGWGPGRLSSEGLFRLQGSSAKKRSIWWVPAPVTPWPAPPRRLSRQLSRLWKAPEIAHRPVNRLRPPSSIPFHWFTFPSRAHAPRFPRWCFWRD